MGIDAPQADNVVIMASLVWVGLLAWLFVLTRSFNKMLAWVFVVIGIVAPAALLQGATGVVDDQCTEKVMRNGFSADRNYNYVMVEKTCLGSGQKQFEVRFGFAREFAPLYTAFEGNRWSRPIGVQQHGRNEFTVLLAPAKHDGGDADSTRKLIVRLDPDTARPLNTYQYFWRAGAGS